MGKGIGEVLTFGVGVAISPAGIIAVILVLFSRRARVNGPLFLLGWVVALGTLAAVVYAISNQSNAGSSNTSSDSVSWLKIALGVGLLLLARREFRKRPEPGAEREMPKWMKRVDGLTPIQALGLGGALGAEILGLDPVFPLKYMIYFLIVVTVGGTSSITGPFLASILLGIGDVAGKYYVPQVGAFVIYTIMIVVLIWRPQGLFARQSAR